MEKHLTEAEVSFWQNHKELGRIIHRERIRHAVIRSLKLFGYGVAISGLVMVGMFALLTPPGALFVAKFPRRLA